MQSIEADSLQGDSEMADENQVANPKIQVRLRPKLLQDVLHSAQLRGLKQSDFVRRLMTIETALDRKTPYFAEGARHFLFVSSEGWYWYRRLEWLRMNSSLGLIPASIAIKPEKKVDYIKKTQSDSDAIRQYWKLNSFALVNGGHWSCPGSDQPSLSPESLGKRPATYLGTASDETGVSVKSAVMEPRRVLRHGELVIRETIAVLEDFVQWFEEPGGPDEALFSDPDDHADLVLDVQSVGPIDCLVVVDRDLFEHSQASPVFHQSPLSLVWRTRDQLPFLRDPFRGDSKFTRINSSSSRFSVREKDEPYNNAMEAIRVEFEAFRLRLQDGRLLGMDNGGHGLQRKLEQPQDHFFYQFRLPYSHLGVFPSIRWPKPDYPQERRRKREASKQEMADRLNSLSKDELLQLASGLPLSLLQRRLADLDLPISGDP